MRSTEGQLAPRRKPRQRRSAATVDTIVEAATRVLEAHGPAGFNTNAIAARAGVSVGSIYQDFPNKDALMAETIRRDSSDFLARLRLAAGSGTATVEPLPAERFAAMVREAVAHQLERPGLALMLDVEQARLPIDEDDAMLQRALVGLVVGVLESLPVPPATPARDALDLIGIVRGMIDTSAAAGERDRDELERRVLRAVSGYLGQPMA